MTVRDNTERQNIYSANRVKRFTSFSDASGLSLGSIIPRGISIESAGALRIETSGGDDITYASGELNVGQIYPIQVVKVFSTTTTVSGVKIYG